VSEIGKTLVLVGLLLAAIGAAFMLAGKVPFLGKLPGDIFVKKENFTFYFPLTTCILVSVVLTIVMYLFNKK
jgi:uncharacterized protein HemY